MTTTIDKHQTQAREARIRRALAKDGYVLRKSRFRGPARPDDHGEYMVIEANLNAIVVGSRFDYSLDDVEEWMNTPEST